MLATQLSLTLTAPQAGNEIAELIKACLTHSMSVSAEQINLLKRKRRNFCWELFYSDPFNHRKNKRMQLNQFTRLIIEEYPALSITPGKNNPSHSSQVRSLPQKYSLMDKFKNASLNFLASEYSLICAAIISLTIFVGVVLASSTIFSPALLILSASGVTLSANAIMTINVALYALAGTALGAGVTTLSYITTWITQRYRAIQPAPSKIMQRNSATRNLKKDFFGLTVDTNQSSRLETKNGNGPMLFQKKQQLAVYVPDKHARIETEFSYKQVKVKPP